MCAYETESAISIKQGLTPFLPSQATRIDKCLVVACAVFAVVVTVPVMVFAGTSVAERLFTSHGDNAESVQFWNSILLSQLGVEKQEDLAGPERILYETVFSSSRADNESALEVLQQLPLTEDGAVALKTVLLIVLGGESLEIDDSLRECAVARQPLARRSGCVINRILFISHTLLNGQARAQVNRYLFDEALAEYTRIVEQGSVEERLVKDMERLCISLLTVRAGGCSEEFVGEVAGFLRTGQRRYSFGPSEHRLDLHMNDVLRFVCFGQGSPCEEGRKHLRKIVFDELRSIVAPLERAVTCHRIAGNLRLLHGREYSAVEARLGIAPFADDRRVALDLVKQSISRQRKIDKDTLLKAFEAALVTDTDLALTIHGAILLAATEADGADAAILLGHSQEVLGSITTLATYYRAKCGAILETSGRREKRGKSGLDSEEKDLLHTTQQRITELVKEHKAVLEKSSELWGGYDQPPPGARVRARLPPRWTPRR